MKEAPKPGSGTANKPRHKSANGPDFKGVIRLLTGEIMGVAVWVKSGPYGEFLSISYDERETAYQAATLKLDACSHSRAPAVVRVKDDDEELHPCVPVFDDEDAIPFLRAHATMIEASTFEIAIPEFYVSEIALSYYEASARARTLAKEFPGYTVRVNMIANVMSYNFPMWKGDE